MKNRDSHISPIVKLIKLAKEIKLMGNTADQTSKIVEFSGLIENGVSLKKARKKTLADTETLISLNEMYYNSLLNIAKNKNSEQLYMFIQSSGSSFDPADLQNLLQLANNQLIGEEFLESSFFILSTILTYQGEEPLRTLMTDFPNNIILSWAIYALKHNDLSLMHYFNRQHIVIDDVIAFAKQHYLKWVSDIESRRNIFQNQEMTLDQEHIRSKLLTYLKQNKIDDKGMLSYFDSSIDSRAGHCAGLTTLYLYGKYLERTTVKENIKMDDSDWFFNTLRTISRWDEDLNNLTAEEKNDIDRFVSLIEYFQRKQFITHHSPLFRPHNISFIDQSLEDTKSRKLGREYSLVGCFDEKQLSIVLPEIIKENNLFYLGSEYKKEGLHAVGIFKSGNCYFYYNSNHESGERVTQDIQELSKWISNTFKKDPKVAYLYQMVSYNFDKTNKNYPQQEVILDRMGRFSLNLRNSKVYLETAVDMNCIESARFFVKKGDSNNATAIRKALNMNAMGFGNDEMVVLLATNTDLSLNLAPDNESKTPKRFLFHQILQMKNWAIIDLILEKAASDGHLKKLLLLKDDYGNSSLHTALLNPLLDDNTIEKMISTNPNILFIDNNEGLAPLELIFGQEKRRSLFEKILKENSEWMVDWAVNEKKSQFLENVIKDQVLFHCLSPETLYKIFQFSIQYNDLPLANFILESSNIQALLEDAVLNNFFDGVNFILISNQNKIIDIDAHHYQTNESLLSIACKNNNKDICDLLLKMGCLIPEDQVLESFHPLIESNELRIEVLQLIDKLKNEMVILKSDDSDIQKKDAKRMFLESLLIATAAPDEINHLRIKAKQGNVTAGFRFFNISNFTVLSNRTEHLFNKILDAAEKNSKKPIR